MEPVETTSAVRTAAVGLVGTTLDASIAAEAFGQKTGAAGSAVAYSAQKTGVA